MSSSPTPSAPSVPSRRILLDPDEETALAIRIEAGALASAVLRGEWPAGDATTDELAVLARAGAEAFSRYIEANLALIGLVLRQEFGQRTTDPDLFQEGCLGLIEAVRRFDHRRGCRFATYAIYWIQAHVRGAGEEVARASGLSAEMAAQLRRARGVATRLSQELGREPRTSELADALGRPVDWTGQLLSRRPAAPLADVGAGQLVDTGAERAFESVLDEAMPGEELLVGLAPLTRRVLRLRYGFDTGPDAGRPGRATARATAQVARITGLTVRQIRRIEADGLDQLRGTCPQQARIHLAG